MVEKIIITAGAIYDEMEEPVSLVGEYTIVDPAAVGTARRWYCPQTTASGDYQAYNYGVTIGCLEVESGNWDENDNPIYDKYWVFAPGTDFDEWSYWLSTQTEGLESPFLVQDWRGYGGTIVTAPVLTSDVTDASPYGPTGWKGRPIVMTDGPVFFTCDAGVKSANGFWELIAGEGVAATYQWQCIGSDAIIKDPYSVSDPTYHSWELYATDNKGNYGKIYGTPGEPTYVQPVIHPALRADWSSNSSAYDPIPTFVYSETGGYAPAKNDVSGLTYTNKLPKISEIWNDGATIKADRFFPA